MIRKDKDTKIRVLKDGEEGGRRKNQGERARENENQRNSFFSPDRGQEKRSDRSDSR